MSEEITHQKVALVTGANKGIGRGVAEQLAALGMTVLIGARDTRRGEEAAAAVRAAGGDAHAVTLDVTDQATVQDAAKQVEERFGHLDVLVNNAGITGSGQVSPEDARDQVPSSVDLDSNNHTGFLTVAQGAAVVVRLAVVGTDGPTAGFFSEEGSLPW